MKKYDLIVTGGGVAGIAASVSAAREGLKVLLIEKTCNLGGALSNSLVFPFMRHRTLGKEKKIVCAGIFKEIKERFKEYNHSSWEVYKFVFDDIVNEAGVEVLLHSTVYKIDNDGRNLTKIYVSTKSGIMEFEADFYIDTTGDGELINLSGCDYQIGRESDGYCQPMTSCFRLSNVDIKKYQAEKPALQIKYKEARERGEITNPRENILTFAGLGDGILHFNTTRIVKLNPVDPFDITKAEMTARKQIIEIFNFLKENSEACKNAVISSIGSHIGVRESRKLKGVHILTGEEIINLTQFEDTVALGNYSIDIHNPTGTGTTMREFSGDSYYRIPYRSLLPKEYDNMLVAGRCLSADHEAHSTARVMPVCFCTGEAAGIAIAVAKKTGKNAHTVDVNIVRQRLKEVGAVVD